MPDNLPPLATDIQAALTVIGRRNTSSEPPPWALAVNLAGAHIPKADLIATTLSGATLSGANLREAILLGTAVSAADLLGAKNLTQDQLDSACGDEKTKLDPPLKIEPCPPHQPAAGSAK